MMFRTKRLSWSALLSFSAASSVVTLPAFSQESPAQSQEPVYELNPFQVDASQDKGYRATNTISGSRLNTRLKDIPMPIEVITEEFVDDIGATDLREALRYSSGILTTSQNDAGKGNSSVGPGGVHNAEGTTANKTSTSYKVRGFITEATLRDGYRRQITSDSVNIGRVEVVRGPSALLYGIGNFGGIVNYIPKMPKDVKEQSMSLGIGNNGYSRATYEANVPLGMPWDAKFLLTAAYEENESFTEFANGNHLFYSPVLTFSPTENTNVVLDFENGDYKSSGIGYQSVRVNGSLNLADAASQQDRLEHSGFLVFPDEADLRTMRLSGSDTYLNTDFDNFRGQVTHRFAENLNLLVGFSEANVEYDKFDMGGSVAAAIPGNATHARFSGPAWVMTSNGDIAQAVDANGAAVPMLGQGTELREVEDINRQQLRAELNYNFQMFGEREKWSMTHSFLAGRSHETYQRSIFKQNFADGQFNYFDPSELIYRRAGLNSDGSQGFSPTDSSLEDSVSKNTGLYAVYQGRFFEDRVTAIVGRRQDKNDVWNSFENLRTGTDPVITISEEQTNYTSQVGVSFEIVPELTLFALRAEGLSPNFDGKRDLNGNAIKASTAESEEIGLKFELFEGKLSGSISAYKIEQIGKPTSLWWAPANGKSTFRRNEEIIYNVSNFGPGFAGGNGAAEASQAEWDAAVAAGAIMTLSGDPSNPTRGAWEGVGTPYLSASTPEGAAYLNSVFYKTRGVELVNGELVSVAADDPNRAQKVFPGWAGWLYMRDDYVNAAFEDWSAPDNEWDAWSPSNEESTGWEINLQYQPKENWQLVFSGSRTERSVTKVFDMVTYEWGSYNGQANIDRWATWFYPDGSWGLTGAMAPNEAYADEANADTGSWQAVGLLQGQPQDDTPEYEFSFWTTYGFEEGRLAGLQLGFGTWWQDKREFESGITDGSGQIAIDPATGRPFNKTHKDRYEANVMAKYNMKVNDKPAYVQLNIDNVTNDKSRYGWIHAPGRTWKLSYGLSF